MEKRGYTTSEAATYLGRSVSFLKIGRCYGHADGREPGPRYVKKGRSVLYLKEDLDSWLEGKDEG